MSTPHSNFDDILARLQNALRSVEKLNSQFDRTEWFEVVASDTSLLYQNFSRDQAESWAVRFGLAAAPGKNLFVYRHNTTNIASLPITQVLANGDASRLDGA